MTSGMRSCKRTMQTGYFRCCYAPLLRRKTTLFLILAITGLAILALTSDMRTRTQAAARHQPARSSFSLRRVRHSSPYQPNTAHQPSALRGPQPITSHQPSGRRLSKRRRIPVNGDQTENVPGMVKAGSEQEHPLGGARGNHSSKDTHSSGRVQSLTSLRDRKETDNARGEARHVFFLKVHKAGSTTVMNVLYRFAVSRRLNVMLPRTGNILSETSPRWTDKAMPLPRGATHFDILCNHVVYNESAVRRSLPEDAKFVAILREPFQQFLSAFFYYRIKFRAKYLMKIPEEDPLNAYLQNPGKYEGKFGSRKSFTYNRMSFDFGMTSAVIKSEESIDRYIDYLNKTFDLVMINERFDESMVLMKRLLGWKLQDVLYIKNNVFSKHHDNNYTAEQKLSHRNFNLADYRLYDHFVRLFQSKVEQEGHRFQEEVEAFVALREKLQQFCREAGAASVRFPATDWTTEFELNKTDCQLMTLVEGKFVGRMRARQYAARS